MKRVAVLMAVAGVMAAGAAATAWGARHALKADGWLSALQADGEVMAPLEWEHVGRITDAEGNPVTGAHVLEVRLYGAAEGGDVLWARKAPALLDEAGNFSVRLSDALSAPDGAPETTLTGVLAEHMCWIECQLDDHSVAMSPRAAVAAAPYALFADAAAGAREDFEAAVSLVVAGATTTESLTARNAESAGAVKTSGTLTVGGDASLSGGLRAGSYTGIGAMPVGSVIMWYGDADHAPDGWAFCDGKDGRPNLVGRFPVGAGNQYKVGDSGGAATVTLSTDELPAHSHGYELRDDNNRDSPNPADGNDGVWKSDKKVGTSSTGGGQPHENLPPYLALRYIVRVE